AERQLIYSRANFNQALAVALHHLEVSQQVMREQNGLRALKVRVTRHHRIKICFSQLNNRALKLADERVQAINLSAQKNPQISSDLIVAAATRMNLVSRIAYCGDKLRF